MILPSQQGYVPYIDQVFELEQVMKNNVPYHKSHFQKFRQAREFKVKQNPFSAPIIEQFMETETENPEEQHAINYDDEVLFGIQLEDEINNLFNDDIKPQVDNYKLVNENEIKECLQIEITPMIRSGNLFPQTEQLLPALLEIHTYRKPINQQPKFLGLDLVCLIDTSSFMNKEYFKQMKKSLHLLNKFMTMKDRISFIYYNSNAERHKQLQSYNSKEIDQQINEIQQSNIRLSNLPKALELGIQVIKSRKFKENLPYILIFTGNYDATEFNNQQIKTIVSSTQDLFTIYSFGFGSNTDLHLLNQINTMRFGIHTQVKDYQALDQVFAYIFGGQTMLAAENIKITISPIINQGLDPIKINNVYGDRCHYIEQFGEYQIALPYSPSQMRYCYPIELIIPKKNNSINLKELKLINVSIQYFDSIDRKEYFQQKSLKIKLNDNKNTLKSLNRTVQQEYYEQILFKALFQAQDFLSENNKLESQRILTQCINIFNNTTDYKHFSIIIQEELNLLQN